MNSEILTLALIFFARVCDVSIGTMRIILVARGYRYVAPLLGFAEVLIWLTAITYVMQNLHSVVSYVVFAAGFATGNYVGMILEAKIAIGYQSLRIITSKMVSALPLELREQGFGVTTVDGHGLRGPVTIYYVLARKKDVKNIIETVNVLEPKAFITVEDISAHQMGFIATKMAPSLNISLKGK